MTKFHQFASFCDLFNRGDRARHFSGIGMKSEPELTLVGIDLSEIFAMEELQTYYTTKNNNLQDDLEEIALKFFTLGLDLWLDR